MGDMREVFDAMKDWDRARKVKNLAAADPTGWTIHTEFHWSRDLAGHQLNYWPSRNKFQWRGKVMTGDVQGFIRKREPTP